VWDAGGGKSITKIFGSRAKGNHQRGSDIDIALWWVTDDFAAQAIALELDELSLPYTYDVKAFAAIRLPSLRELARRHADLAKVARAYSRWATRWRWVSDRSASGLTQGSLLYHQFGPTGTNWLSRDISGP